MARRHWIMLLVVVSLSLNLLVAGALVARWQAGPAHPPPLIWAFKDLDSETRRSLRPILRDGLEETSKARNQLRIISRDIRKIIESEPLDEEALSVALENLRAVTGAYQAQMHASALKVLPTLAPEQRVMIAGRLLRPGAEPPHPPQLPGHPAHPRAPHPKGLPKPESDRAPHQVPHEPPGAPADPETENLPPLPRGGATDSNSV